MRGTRAGVEAGLLIEGTHACLLVSSTKTRKIYKKDAFPHTQPTKHSVKTGITCSMNVNQTPVYSCMSSYLRKHWTFYTPNMDDLLSTFCGVSLLSAGNECALTRERRGGRVKRTSGV